MIYKYIRSVKKSNTLPPTILYNESSATESTDKASLFNKYFLSVFNTTSFELPANSDLLDPTLSRHLLLIQISEQDVQEAFVSLRSNMASGIDGIGPNILKKCAYILIKPLYHLFSISLSKHAIPQEWRTHTIVPYSTLDFQNLQEDLNCLNLWSSNWNLLFGLSIICDPVWQNRSYSPKAYMFA